MTDRTMLKSSETIHRLLPTRRRECGSSRLCGIRDHVCRCNGTYEGISVICDPSMHCIWRYSRKPFAERWKWFAITAWQRILGPILATPGAKKHSLWLVSICDRRDILVDPRHFSRGHVHLVLTCVNKTHGSVLVVMDMVGISSCV
jgi:hypothetical protein